jgi:hypothetical protein
MEVMWIFSTNFILQYNNIIVLRKHRYDGQTSLLSDEATVTFRMKTKSSLENFLLETWHSSEPYWLKKCLGSFTCQLESSVQ